MKVVSLSEPLLVAGGLLLVGGLLFVQVRPRHVRVRRQWLVAAAVALVTSVVLSQRPPYASDWPWLAVAGIAGLVVGAMRANLSDTRAIDLAGDALDVQNTRLGVLVWGVALVARVGLRQVVGRSNPDDALIRLVTEGLLLFAVGNLVGNAASVQRIVDQARRRTA